MFMCLALIVMSARAISWATMTVPVLMVYIFANMKIVPTGIQTILIGGLGPLNLILFLM